MRAQIPTVFRKIIKRWGLLPLLAENTFDSNIFSFFGFYFVVFWVCKNINHTFNKLCFYFFVNFNKSPGVFFGEIRHKFFAVNSEKLFSYILGDNSSFFVQ